MVYAFNINTKEVEAEETKIQGHSQSEIYETLPKKGGGGERGWRKERRGGEGRGGGLGMVVYAFKTRIWEASRSNLCGFEATLVYIAGSRMVAATRTII